jgi:hypothetical protein
MIEASAVAEIITQYETHGWTLRRALLSPEANNAFAGVLDSVKVEDSLDLDALWFSRQSKPDCVAWELRRLTALPFALIAVVSTTATADEIEQTLAQVVDEMRAKTIA